ncbi:MAG: hypothetical protein ACP5D6_06475 [Kosmotogaceae bacterium]
MKKQLIETQKALRDLKELLGPKGEYTIKRKDGGKIWLVNEFMFGTIFEILDDFLELDLEEIRNYDLLKNKIEEIHQETEEQLKKPFVLITHANYVEGKSSICCDLLNFINKIERKKQ